MQPARRDSSRLDGLMEPHRFVKRTPFGHGLVLPTERSLTRHHVSSAAPFWFLLAAESG